MKNHIFLSKKLFEDGCRRAERLVLIYEYLKKSAPSALDVDDILRSALVLAVSSFDLFIHDLFRLEVIYKVIKKDSLSLLRIPFNVLIANDQDKVEIIDEHIRRENSYKSFVAPDKLAECLRLFMEKPWDKISSALGNSNSVVKSRLKSVVDLRNRIAHEADVNPAYAGIELWPIYVTDVKSSIDFLRLLGDAIADVMDNC